MLLVAVPVRVTVKVAFFVPLLPSVMVTSLMERVAGVPPESGTNRSVLRED
jgi:hypothetical protein